MTTVNRPTIVITQQQASTGDAPDTNHRTVELSDGSFVVVYRLANGDIRFQQFDRVGNSIGDEGVLVAGSAGGDFDVLAIEDGQLVLAHETTSGDIEVSSFAVANGTATANGTVSETFSSTGAVFDPVLSGNSASDVALHFIETVSGVSSLQEHRSISGGQFSATTSTVIEATADSVIDSIILANGNRVVVVDPNGAGATGDGDVSIFLVAPDGTVVASPTATAPAGSAVSEVRVTGLVDGGFVVAYEADGADTDVLFQVFNADGSARTGAISAPNSSNQHETPEIVALEDGGFLVFFDEKTGGNTLIVQRFDANGDPIGQSSSVANGIGVSSPSATILSDGLVAVSFLNAGVVNVTIIGTQGLDIVLTGADESINGTVIGDIIDGDAGNDTINGGSGLDELSGGLGDDLINGGSGDDTLLGGNGLDTINGGSGDDRIIVRSFDFIDEIDGGDNTDTLDMSDYLFNFVTVNLLNETYTVGGGAGVQSIVNVENVIGSDTSDDDLTGDDEDNQIEGLGGNDTLNGLGGNDTLIGGKGDDEVFGGLGEDLIVWNNGDGSDLFNGGDGTDTVQINFNTDLENDDLQNDDEAEFKTGANGVDFARVRLNDQAVNGLFSLDIRETEVIDVNFGGGNDTARIIGDVADQAILDLNGGDGVDALDFSQAGAAVTVDLQTNAVGTIQFRNFENITGSDFDDTLIGTSSSKNFIEGGAGNDRIVGRGTGDTLSGGIGDDSINSGGALNILDGGEGNDTLTGTSKNETFRGGAGADVIIGGGGNQDMLDYSDSDAAVSVSLAGTSATVSGGHAEGDVISEVEHITGSEFGDFLSSNNNKVTIRGLGGDDRIIGGFNSDNLFGGAGDDTISGGSQGDTAFFAGDAANFVVGRSDTGQVRIGDLRTGAESEGVDTTNSVESLGFDDGTVAVSSVIDNLAILGTNKAETISAGADATRIFGFAGDDLIKASAAGQQINGGLGFDTVTFAEASDAVTVNLSDAADNTGLAAGSTFTDVEAVTGSDFDDDLTGDGANNDLFGGDGNDTLDGGAGNDTVNGGDGNDRVLGDDGDDVLFGGSGSDRLQGEDGNDILNGGSNSDTLIGGLGDDTLNGNGGSDTALYVGLSSGVFVTLESESASGGGGDDVLVSIENVFGSGHDDIIFGSNAKGNRLEGSLGNDRLHGLDGRDTLLGGDGEDSLFGGDDVDQLLGQEGDDRIDGGGGTDFLTGGAGADNFVFSSIDDTGVGRFNRDEVRDFSGAEGDRINLFLIDADATMDGNQAFTHVGTSFTGNAGELILNDINQFGVDVTIASMDVDGDGVADGQVYIVGTGITVDDFVL